LSSARIARVIAGDRGDQFAHLSLEPAVDLVVHQPHRAVGLRQAPEQEARPDIAGIELLRMHAGDEDGMEPLGGRGVGLGHRKPDLVRHLRRQVAQRRGEQLVLAAEMAAHHAEGKTGLLRDQADAQIFRAVPPARRILSPAVPADRHRGGWRHPRVRRRRRRRPAERRARALRRAGGTNGDGNFIHFTFGFPPAAAWTGRQFIEDIRVPGRNAVGMGLPW